LALVSFIGLENSEISPGGYAGRTPRRLSDLRQKRQSGGD
jgi:hypothetical protein